MDIQHITLVSLFTLCLNMLTAQQHIQAILEVFEFAVLIWGAC